MSSPGPYPQRVARLRSALGRGGPGAVLVTHLPNVRWLCGFTGSAGALLVTAREEVFLTDFRYRAQSRREVRAARRIEYAAEPAGAIAAEVRRARVSRLGFEADRMTVATHADVTAALSKVELVPLRGVVEQLRATKDSSELAAIRRALGVAASTLAAGSRRLAGRCEVGVRDRIEAGIRGQGCDPSFPTIVASGWRGALPHALPSGRQIRSGDLVVIDFGVRAGGYCCDVTRTFSPGRWGKKSKLVYETVLEAQRAALEAVKPGAKASNVDAAARGVIERAGFGECFGHGTGHGVGLEVHERPNISPKSGDVLAPGMVFTVEPGIYIEDFGGVRIEDMVLVTSTGREVMSRRIPKCLE